MHTRNMDWAAVVDEFIPNERAMPQMKRYKVALLNKMDALSQGHRCMDAMRRDLDRTDSLISPRTYVQIQGQYLFLSCFARKVYGSAADTHPMEILEYNHWESLGTDAAMKTPRRMGKSVLAARLLAVAAMHIEGLRIAIFAASQKQGDKADGMLGSVRTVLVKLGVNLEKKNCDADNKDHLIFRLNGSAREIRSYASAVDSYVFYIFPIPRDSSIAPLPYPPLSPYMPGLVMSMSHRMPRRPERATTPKMRARPSASPAASEPRSFSGMRDTSSLSRCWVKCRCSSPVIMSLRYVVMFTGIEVPPSFPNGIGAPTISSNTSWYCAIISSLSIVGLIRETKMLYLAKSIKSVAK